MGAVIHAVDAMAASIRHSGIGAPMTDSLWLWPLCETLHFSCRSSATPSNALLIEPISDC